MTEACGLPNSLSDTLTWKLKMGSHPFPGPDGGTCINEAAIVAAGFKYKKVESWRDCPPCFSPVISAFAIRLNDEMTYKNRQKLLPFVTRIAGTRGDAETERLRTQWFMRQIVNVDLAAVAEKIKKPAIVAKARAAVTESDFRAVAADFRAVRDKLWSAAAAADAYAADAYAAAYAAAAAADAYAAAYAADAADAYAAAASADAYAADAAASARQQWLVTRGIELLDGLIKFSPAKSDLEPSIAITRLETAKRESIAA